MSYVGVVRSKEGAIDVTALGDVLNVAARLASLADPGEIILSEANISAANLDTQCLDMRRRSLKGRRDAIETYTGIRHYLPYPAGASERVFAA
jgi:class 3 adenylate cyclase